MNDDETRRSLKEMKLMNTKQLEYEKMVKVCFNPDIFDVSHGSENAKRKLYTLDILEQINQRSRWCRYVIRKRTSTFLDIYSKADIKVDLQV